MPRYNTLAVLLRDSDHGAIERLRAALQRSGGVITRAAVELGLDPGTVHRIGQATPAVRAVLDECGIGRVGAAAIARQAPGSATVPAKNGSESVD